MVELKFKGLSIRQPWAWLIVAGYKDIENRGWTTNYRGALYIHASRTISPYLGVIKEELKPRGILLPDEFETGGIIGKVVLADCVSFSQSPWFEGPIGLIVKNPQRLDFLPLRGRPGIFDFTMPG